MHSPKHCLAREDLWYGAEWRHRQGVAVDRRYFSWLAICRPVSLGMPRDFVNEVRASGPYTAAHSSGPPDWFSRAAKSINRWLYRAIH